MFVSTQKAKNTAKGESSRRLTWQPYFKPPESRMIRTVKFLALAQIKKCEAYDSTRSGDRAQRHAPTWIFESSGENLKDVEVSHPA